MVEKVVFMLILENIKLETQGLLLFASVFEALASLVEFCCALPCSSPVSRAFISEGIFPWSMAMHHCLYISSSSLRAQMARSLLETSSSRYWYLSFFLALHSLAL